jgi:hypothetical protein
MKKLAALSLLIAATAAGASTEWASCTLGGVTVPGFSAKTLPAPQFAKLHSAVAPSGAAERWTAIPWASDLQEARRKAIQEKKPLLMWIMDGHPLGCT